MAAHSLQVLMIQSFVPLFQLLPRVLRAVGHVTIQKKFEALREDTVDAPGIIEHHCAATWFGMSTDSDQGAECSCCLNLLVEDLSAKRDSHRG